MPPRTPNSCIFRAFAQVADLLDRRPHHTPATKVNESPPQSKRSECLYLSLYESGPSALGAANASSWVRGRSPPCCKRVSGAGRERPTIRAGGGHRLAGESSRASHWRPARPPRDREAAGSAKREVSDCTRTIVRVAKRVAIMDWRYTRALQLKRARRQLKFLHTRLGRVVRDPSPQDRGQPRARRPLGPATRSRVACAPSRAASAWAEDLFVARPQADRPRQGSGSRVWRLRRSPRQRAGSSCCMPRHWTTNPYDGYAIGLVIANLEKLARVTVRGIHSDKGYRGHNCPDRFKVFISGPVRHTTNAVRREMRRRAAVEPVIGHLQGRSPYGSELSQGPRRRQHRRGSHRRWLQLQPTPALISGAYYTACS